MGEIQAYMEKEYKRYIQQVIATLSYVGEQTVNGIRKSKTNWKDQTGNLRSSIGYIVAVDGKPKKMSGFEAVKVRHVKKDGTVVESIGTQGSKEGKSFAESLVERYPKGIVLIVVAGMEYAAYVEAMENKVVLAQGEIEARKLAAEMIGRLNGSQAK